MSLYIIIIFLKDVIQKLNIPTKQFSLHNQTLKK